MQVAGGEDATEFTCYAKVADKGLYYSLMSEAPRGDADGNATSGAMNKRTVDITGLDEYSQDKKTESLHLEFKSSMLYPVGKIGGASEMDANEQLGWELMQVLAAFMNAEGGELYIGVRDNGEVCGIEKEISMLPMAVVEGDTAGYKYSADEDGFQRKITDVVNEKLGQYASN